MQAPGVKRTAIWDPSHSGKFIVAAANDIKLYQWDQDTSRIRLITVQSDLSLMKCLAWSPHPAYSDLIAIGHGTGKVDLMRLNANISTAAEYKATSGGPLIASLPTQHSRACNSLAFSPVDPNYLAVGLDKVRGQYSLMVWDIESSIVSSPASQPPGIFAARTKRTFKKLPPRAATATYTSAEASPTRRYGSAEIVSSLTFVGPTPYVLAAGMGAKWLRIYDTRDPAESAANAGIDSVPTKAVYGLCADPFDEWKLASYGDDSGVRIWDRRRIDQPVLAFSEADAGGDGGRGGKPLAHIAFSPAKRGLFGTLEREGTYVRLWNLMQETPRVIAKEGGEKDSQAPPQPIISTIPASRLRSNSVVSVSAASNNSQSASPQHTYDPEVNVTPILGHTRKGKVFTQPLASFVFAPESRNQDFAGVRSPHVMTVARDGTIDISRSKDSAGHSWGARGELALSNGKTYRLSDEEWSPPKSEPWEIRIDRAPPRPILPIQPRTIAPDEKEQEREKVKDERPGRPAERHPFPSIDNLPSHINTPKSRTYSPSMMRKFPLGKRREESPAPSKEIEDRDRYLNRSTPSDVDVPQAVVDERREKKTPTPIRSPMERAMSDDISTLIRARVLIGYGLESVHHNAQIARATSASNDLVEVWDWMYLTMDLMHVGSSKMHGYDFTFRGVQSIWEGFPAMMISQAPSEERLTLTDTPQLSPLALSSRPPSSRGHRRPPSRAKSPVGEPSSRAVFETAVDSVNDMRSGNLGLGKQGLPKAAVTSSRTARRKLGLTLCGWDFGDDEFRVQFKKWEEAKDHSRAACWAVFLQDTDACLDILLRSPDDRLRILSGTVKMLVDQQLRSDSDEKPNSWRDHTQRLNVRLEDMYLRAMMSYLSGDAWTDILIEEESLPLRERLAIALLFVPDDQLTKYLRDLTEQLKRKGVIEGLIVTGLAAPGLDIIQAFVDGTGDVQSAAILVGFMSPRRLRTDRPSRDSRIDRWVDAYHNLLDSWKLFHHRCQFDILRGQINQAAIRDGEVAPFEWVARQLFVKCNYCSKIVTSAQPHDIGPYATGSANDRGKATRCPTCRKTLPRCVICLMTVGIPNDSARDIELADGAEGRDTIDDAMVFCQTCRHGGHSAHILDWFFGGEEGKAHTVCAVADCDCPCASWT